MQSNLYKVLHHVAGKPMVVHVLEAVENLKPEKIITVVGHGANEVKSALGNQTEFVLQAEQLGTGHAVIQAEALLKDLSGHTLVTYGDTPLLTAETLDLAFQFHQDNQMKATVLTAIAPDPFGYGRIIRDEEQNVVAIIEQKDANATEAAITEINTGTYIFDNRLLFEALAQVDTNNAQGEFYVTDVIGILKAAGEKVGAYIMPDFNESLGVNDRVQLAFAEKVLRKRINEQHMRNGVTLIDPATVYIESDVKIGRDTIIEAGVRLKGQTVIGANNFISSGTEIIDSTTEDSVSIRQSVIEESFIGRGSDVGPFAHLRPKSKLLENVHVGNFSEIKNATLGNGTKVGHLTYVGDATVGKSVNFGAGTILVNYDGKNKFQTEISDYAFIGSNSNLVSPLKIGANALIAAGSTITKDVAADDLSIGRAKQVNKTARAKGKPHYHNLDN
ncbi:bifunctional UDP-N-acetylglucosamine diphosphorylase/glucosamine-1-phosphate N-acetyltransferase GlmU [Enterococcus sp. MMGLQ5-2]|nr:bifunctional UDP-N-acetylglucosamine diphosphorylase/glucosamine-1-phosphate N-acetyltransferase GlmU [Enterococcus sp. MMGLQ5-2]MBS7583428.1 bifunctional UDP-N-acetylglucosamine diphosphorylase/glucosamine-1-phosphate N-acetyltransferase GlmU [Enterococcus sp. MMGLQ5-1]NPD11288.1 bifunctional UDP-N-acetylglucosamine diphosphorylase/glucosamine-1-phosphate N-acetyltransferase GlmU [Enterococcus sp. MMGLQ5-1]NPD36031.1 bifunctional UDP-N-acetylglucosamine diphosphorylase/glucosamine-1-phosphat